MSTRTESLGRLERALDIKRQLARSEMRSVQQEVMRLQADIRALRQKQVGQAQGLQQNPLTATELTRRMLGMQISGRQAATAKVELERSTQALQRRTQEAIVANSAQQHTSIQLSKTKAAALEQAAEEACEDLLPFVRPGVACTQPAIVQPAVTSNIPLECTPPRGGAIEFMAQRSNSEECTSELELKILCEAQAAPVISPLNSAERRGLSEENEEDPSSSEEPETTLASSAELACLGSVLPLAQGSSNAGGQQMRDAQDAPPQPTPEPDRNTAGQQQRERESSQHSGHVQLEVAAESGRVLQVDVQQQGPQSVHVRLQATKKSDQRVLWRERHLLRSALSSEGLFASVD